MLTFSIDILESNSKISKDILQLIYQELFNRFTKAQSKISQPISLLIERNLKQEPEYSSLLSGKLRLDFGIPDTSVVDKVIENIVSKIYVNIKPIKITANGLSGSLIVNFFNNNDYDSVINSIDASIVDSETGFVIPWVRWLLLEGTTPLVKDYDAKSAPGFGRSGLGFMVSSNGSWSVPNEFAGTASSNWLTRATEKITDNEIQKILQEAIEA